MGMYAPSWNAPIDDVRRMFELNFFAPLALTQLVVPHMRERRSGMIVNVGSIAGKVTLPWFTLYSASKYALGSLTDGLRMELKPRRHSHHDRLSRLCEDRISAACAGEAGHPEKVRKASNSPSPPNSARELSCAGSSATLAPW